VLLLRVRALKQYSTSAGRKRYTFVLTEFKKLEDQKVSTVGKVWDAGQWTRIRKKRHSLERNRGGSKGGGGGGNRRLSEISGKLEREN